MCVCVCVCVCFEIQSLLHANTIQFNTIQLSYYFRKGRSKAADSDDDEEDMGGHQNNGVKSALALRMLNSLLEKENTRKVVLEQFSLLCEILSILQRYLQIVQNRFASEEADDDEAAAREEGYEEPSDELLYSALDMLCKLLLHLMGSDDATGKEKGGQIVSELLQWSKDVLLLVMRTDPAQATMMGDDDDDDNPPDGDGEREEFEKAIKYVEGVAARVAIVATELVAFGLCDDNTRSEVIDLAKGLLAIKSTPPPTHVTIIVYLFFFPHF